MRTRRLVVLGALCASILSTPASGADLGQRWAGKIGRAERLLVAGDYAKARKITVSVADEMIEAMGPGEQAGKALGAVLTLRGLSEAGLGHEDDALWYWHVALNLFPEVADYDLERYGAPGQLLLDNPLPERRTSADCAGELEEGTVGCHDDGRHITPPTVRKSPPPKYPPAARARHEEGSLEVMVAVAVDGSVSHPRVLRAMPSPTMSLALLEAVRQWEFEPAKLDGEPVAFYYRLTANFDLRNP